MTKIFLILFLGMTTPAFAKIEVDRCRFLMAEPGFIWHPEIEALTTSRDLIDKYTKIRTQLLEARWANPQRKNAADFLLPENLRLEADRALKVLLEVVVGNPNWDPTGPNENILSDVLKNYDFHKTYENFFDALRVVTNLASFYDNYSVGAYTHSYFEKIKQGTVLIWPVFGIQSAQSLSTALAADLEVFEVSRRYKAGYTAGHDFVHMMPISLNERLWYRDILLASDQILDPHLRRQIYLAVFNFRESHMVATNNMKKGNPTDLVHDSSELFYSAYSGNRFIMPGLIQLGIQKQKEAIEWFDEYLKAHPYPFPSEP